MGRAYRRGFPSATVTTQRGALITDRHTKRVRWPLPVVDRRRCVSSGSTAGAATTAPSTRPQRGRACSSRRTVPAIGSASAGRPPGTPARPAEVPLRISGDTEFGSACSGARSPVPSTTGVRAAHAGGGVRRMFTPAKGSVDGFATLGWYNGKVRHFPNVHLSADVEVDAPHAGSSTDPRECAPSVGLPRASSFAHRCRCIHQSLPSRRSGD